MSEDVLIQKQIVVKVQFVGFHRYRDAPEEVKFLREWHRHIFFVEAYFQEENSRELEFFMVKRELEKYVTTRFRDKYFELSCEDIAEDILMHYKPAKEVRVYEDNENGAVVRKRAL